MIVWNEWMRRGRKMKRTLYLAASSEIKAMLWLCVGPPHLVFVWPLHRIRWENWCFTALGTLVSTQLLPTWKYLQWSAGLKAQDASSLWSPWRNTGPTKNESKALTRTGELICQTPVRGCHQKCWEYSFIYKECQPEIKIKSIIRTNYLNLMTHDALVCGIKIECDIFVLQ